MASIGHTLAAIFFGVVALSCRTPGTRPEEMSEAGHEAAAAEAARKSSEHAAQYDPAAATLREQCSTKRPCWTSVVNPTEEHRAEARRYAKIAAEHRAASQALRDAETRACNGIPDEDRDVSPFFRREDILSVEPLRVGVSHVASTRLVGATVGFRPVPGLTPELLQRIIECHQGRNAVLGYDQPEMTRCPLALPGVTARVRSGGDRLVVDIRSEDPATASEILKRAERLAPGQPDRG